VVTWLFFSTIILFDSFAFCSLAENIAFLLGSAYFVAGSYPEDGEAESGKNEGGESNRDDDVEGGIQHFEEVSSPAKS
jgi:hypothetical protein